MYKRQVNSEGVINSLAGMDYIFTPSSADKVVLESSLSFAMAIQKLLVRNEACRLAGLYLFWNMVDGREKTDLYTAYDKTCLLYTSIKWPNAHVTIYPLPER